MRRRRRRRRKWWNPFWWWRHRSSIRRRRRFDIRLRRRRRSQRRAAWAAGAVLVGVAGLAALAMRDAVHIRGRLVAAHASLQRALDDPAALASPEGRAAALAEVDSALVSIDDARHSTTGSRILSLVGAFPVVGGQRSGLLALIDDSSAAAGAGRRLLATVDELADRNRLQDGVVPVETLGRLQAEVEAAGQVLAGVAGGHAGAPWGPVGDARRRFDDLAEVGSRRLTTAAAALGAARSFVGSAGSRRYLVALQNNAEMRDQGAVLSYVVITFVDGRLTFERRGSIIDLPLAEPAPTPLPPGTAEVFGPLAPTQTWQSVNFTADFAVSGRVMADMYRQSTGQAVDGVVAIDVPGLAAILRVVGPVAVEGVAEPIGADNVGRVVLHDFYEGLVPGEAVERRERLDEVMGVVVDRLTTGDYDAVTLGRGLGDAAGGGHLRLWSATAAEDDVFRDTGLGGGPAAHDADRTFHLAVANRTATKLDYYVKPSVRYDVHLTGDGSAVVRTTVTVENTAPVGAAPSYQLGPDRFTENPGDYVAWVLLWGPAGSTQSSGGVVESGLNLAQRIVPVAAGERREVVFETVVPDAVGDGELRLRLVPQPRLEPVPAAISITGDGWDVDGEPGWTGVLDRVQALSWEVTR